MARAKIYCCVLLVRRYLFEGLFESVRVTVLFGSIYWCGKYEHNSIRRVELLRLYSLIFFASMAKVGKIMVLQWQAKARPGSVENPRNLLELLLPV